MTSYDLQPGSIVELPPNITDLPWLVASTKSHQHAKTGCVAHVCEGTQLRVRPVHPPHTTMAIKAPVDQ